MSNKWALVKDTLVNLETAAFWYVESNSNTHNLVFTESEKQCWFALPDGVQPSKAIEDLASTLGATVVGK